MRKGFWFLTALVALAATCWGTTLVLQPDEAAGKDSEVDNANPSTNWGTYTYITVNWSGSYTSRGLLEFDLSSINGATVNSASLELYNWANNPNRVYEIHRITATWSESTVTWNNQPAFDAAVAGSTNVTGSGTFTFTITSLVQSWLNGTYTNYGMVLKAVTEPASPNPYFVSSSYATAASRPKLTVDYTLTGVAPTSLGRVKAIYN